ncbi:alpha/beta hydrolase [Rossellomorea vietnamensis]|uniref:Alpha/beta hydrolase n=1 Tax=Rossellomorea vietnamensis TaxID=218284 RepID=A0A5D4NV78_9BACI|nr:alpha/beta hydrolase [Rossellomorea vietnamensis]TYS17581.1 alpha/beta hydrolase [Rossellomorea vietnamensis]
MLHYRTYVKDTSWPWVTFIHGAGGSSSIWFKQIKDFKKEFNVLLIDLRGHGSSQASWKKGDSFVNVAEEVIDVLDYLKIKSSHFIGISLGTIVVQTLAGKHPERLSSMILAGAIIKLNLRTKFLLAVGNAFKFLIPYMWLYKLFAWIIMPQPRHVESRYTFVKQARKMCQKEFIRWLGLTKSINPYLKNLQIDSQGIPTLFVMGEEDHLFLAPVKQLVEKQKELDLHLIEDSGHVCNIDQPDKFNSITLKYLRKLNPVPVSMFLPLSVFL